MDQAEKQEVVMYKYYCKDNNCQGHTKSWERCCDLKAFSFRNTSRIKTFKIIGPKVEIAGSNPSGKHIVT